MAPVTESVSLDVRDGVAVLTVDNPPVNALSHHVRTGIADGVEQAVADDSVEAIVLLCAGRTFIAGADIGEIRAITDTAVPRKVPVKPSMLRTSVT